MGLVKRIVSPIFASGTSSATFVSSGPRYHVAIGGVPFMLAVAPGWQGAPMLRETAEFSRPSVDQSNDAGGWSLGFWWNRRQMSFHAGAGQDFLDGSDPSTPQDLKNLRFLRSKGVDVWTAGSVTLLPDTIMAHAFIETDLKLAVVEDSGGGHYALTTHGAALNRKNLDSTYGDTDLTWGGTGTILALACDGSNYYVVDSTGVYKGSFAVGAAAGVQIYALSSPTHVTLAWVKQRLMAAVDGSVYELDCNATGATPLPTAKYTHPDPSWVWTCISEGPGAVYAGGYTGNSSSVYKFELDNSGAVPTLTSAITTLDLPLGEVIHTMHPYLGTYMALGTSKGIRVGKFSGSDIGDGRLSVRGECKALAARDRFFYGGYPDPFYTDAAALARIDLDAAIADGLYAWAADLRANNPSGGVDSFQAGTVTGVGVTSDDRVVFVVGTKGLFVQDTNLVSTGSLTTSRMTYGATEQKLFKRLDFRHEGSGKLAAKLAIEADANGAEVVTCAASDDAASTGVKLTARAANFATLEFLLYRDGTTTTTGPTFRGFTLHALPSFKRHRVMQLPLRLYDKDSDAKGTKVGTAGWALQRLEALEALEDAGNPVKLQFLAGPKAQHRTYEVVVDKVVLDQRIAPNDDEMWGGVVTVVVRTV